MLFLVGSDNGILASREPVANVWRQTANFHDAFKVFKVLNVAAVMPAKDIHRRLVDLKRHCIHPFSMNERSKATIQGIFHVTENVTPFQSVTFRANGALHIAKARAYAARLRGNGVGKAWHLGWLGKATSDLFGKLRCHRGQVSRLFVNVNAHHAQFLRNAPDGDKMLFQVFAFIFAIGEVESIKNCVSV